MERALSREDSPRQSSSYSVGLQDADPTNMRHHKETSGLSKKGESSSTDEDWLSGVDDALATDSPPTEDDTLAEDSQSPSDSFYKGEAKKSCKPN